MRLRRSIDGELGPPRTGSWVPVIPPRWRLPALVVTVVVCTAIFVTALVLGLHRT
ncbi:MAG: hypothetical protein JOZ75_08565 [Candidatus Dormibacteraeota bacterium]|nr:hypothetical protein [Candidatus Dormibacteraeota bacterium]